MLAYVDASPCRCPCGTRGWLVRRTTKQNVGPSERQQDGPVFRFGLGEGTSGKSAIQTASNPKVYGREW
jgi:hypothetical protein